MAALSLQSGHASSFDRDQDRYGKLAQRTRSFRKRMSVVLSHLALVFLPVQDNAGHLDGDPAFFMHTHHALPITPASGSGTIAAPDGCRGIYREVGVLRLAPIQDSSLIFESRVPKLANRARRGTKNCDCHAAARCVANDNFSCTRAQFRPIDCVAAQLRRYGVTQCWQPAGRLRPKLAKSLTVMTS